MRRYSDGSGPFEELVEIRITEIISSEFPGRVKYDGHSKSTGCC